MSRTQVRIVLILIAFILVMAAILSGVVTYLVGADGSPPSTPEDGAAGQALLAEGGAPTGSWQADRPQVPSSPSHPVGR